MAFVTCHRMEGGWQDGPLEDDVEETLDKTYEEHFEQDDPEADPLETEAAASIKACDDHLQVRKQMAAVLDELEPPGAEAEGSEASSCQKKKGTGCRAAAKDPVADDPDKAKAVARAAERARDAELSVHNFVEALRKLPPCCEAPTEETALSLLLARMEAARKTVLEFTRCAQCRENFLPKAQIGGPGKKPELSTWNAVEHELALARQASALDGGQDRTA